MKIKQMSSLVIMIAIVFGLHSCNSASGKHGDYKFTKSGIGYKFHVENKDAATPQLGSLLTMKLAYGSEDSVFYTTDFIPEGVMVLPLNEPMYDGDLFEALSMMHKGDSASFLLKAEPFFLQTAGFPEVPDFAKGIEHLVFNVKLEKIQTESEMQAEYEAQMAEAQTSEQEKIEQYLADNNITVQPTASGMYYIEHTRGRGEKPKAGDRVKVHYTGTLLDGKKFDSSVDRGQPFEFVLGRGQVIRGWDEGIALMTVGTKATFVLPSHMAYGDRGAGRDIGPYTPLVFEVELLDIIKN